MLIRKRQYRNSQASIVEVGNRDEFPDFVDLLFFFGIHFFRVGQSIGSTHIFLFGLICSLKLFYIETTEGCHFVEAGH